MGKRLQRSTGDRGFGCLMLFGIPFAGAGAASLISGLRQAQGGVELDEDALVQLLLGALFVLVGLGVIAAGYWGRSHAQRTERLKAAHPDEPWKWRDDWARGQVEASTRSEMLFSWGFALFWNLISTPGLIAGRDEIASKGPWVAALAAMFPLVGLLLLYWAFKTTLRYRKYGGCELELATLPASPGGSLRGVIHTKMKRRPENVRLDLTSLNRSTCNDSSKETPAWQESALVRGAALSRSRGGVSIPVNFPIPADAAPSSPDSSSSGTLWRLQASAETPGLDFTATFEVPVFRVGPAADSSSAEPAAAWARSSSRPPLERGRSAAVERIGPRGETELYFGAFRNRGAAAGLLVFLMLWLSFLAAIVHFGAPWIFSAVWALFALLIGIFAIDLCLGSYRIRLGLRELQLRYAILGIGRSRSIRYADVSDVKPAIGMRRQASLTQSPKLWYDLEIHRRAGRKRFAARHLDDKAEAERLAELILLRARQSHN